MPSPAHDRDHAVLSATPRGHRTVMPSPAQDRDHSVLSVTPRGLRTGAVLGNSLVNCHRHDSPTGEPSKSLRGAASGSEGKEQLEIYKKSIEHLILDRHYELERSLERMLQDALGSASDAKFGTSKKGESKHEHTTDHVTSAQLERMLKASEARAAHEYSLSTQQTIYGAIRSIEKVLETELNRLYDLITTTHKHGHGGHGLEASPANSRSRKPKMHSLTSVSTHVVVDKVAQVEPDPLDKEVRFIASTKELNTKLAEIVAQENKDRSDILQDQSVSGRCDMSRSSNTKSSGGALKWVKKQVDTVHQVSRELGKAVGFNKAAEAAAKTRDIFLRAPTAEKNKYHGWVQKVAHSWFFFGLCQLAIVTNVGIKAVQMDMNVRRAARHEDDVQWGDYVDIIFTALFAVELLIRMIADHWYFFFGSQKLWNLFDTCVVASSCVEMITDGLNVGFLRIFRSLRLVRVLKIIRVFRFFRELRLMAVSIASCMASLFWALVMMFVVVLVFAMFVLEGSKNFLRDDKYDGESRRTMIDLFGSFPKAIYSLIQAISGGNDWAHFADPLVEVSWVYAVGFSLFISFVTLGMMNILIGIFVDNARHYSHLDRDLVIQEEMHQRKSYMNQLRDLFSEMDQDNSGTVTYQEFNDCLSHERARAYLEFLQLSASEAQGLFMLLDLDENGEVGVEEFVLGCMRLKGTAKSIDAASMMFQTKRLACKLNEFFDYTRGKMEKVVGLLEDSDAVESRSPEQDEELKKEPTSEL